MIEASNTAIGNFPISLVNIVRAFTIGLCSLVVVMVIPVGRRYYHPIFVPIIVAALLWDISSILTLVERIDQPLGWPLMLSLPAAALAFLWQIFLMWRWQKYGKIDTGSVRNYYRGMLAGHDPSVEGKPED